MIQDTGNQTNRYGANALFYAQNPHVQPNLTSVPAISNTHHYKLVLCETAIRVGCIDRKVLLLLKQIDQFVALSKRKPYIILKNH
jgi:hypothetical protein